MKSNSKVITVVGVAIILILAYYFFLGVPVFQKEKAVHLANNFLYENGYTNEEISNDYIVSLEETTDEWRVNYLKKGWRDIEYKNDKVSLRVGGGGFSIHIKKWSSKIIWKQVFY